ncbi:hypothetical protein TNCV_2615671 [Trichonephila clavipes]|nr:hypothetical protein TNCV_2615671 [Trichonephila clavipes]
MLCSRHEESIGGPFGGIQYVPSGQLGPPHVNLDKYCWDSSANEQMSHHQFTTIANTHFQISLDTSAKVMAGWGSWLGTDLDPLQV